VQNLFRRASGVWVARLAVPKRLRHVLWRSEFIESTNTRDLAIAKLVACALVGRWRMRLYEADRLARDAPMDQDYETVLRIAEGSPELQIQGHLPLERAAKRLGLEPAFLLGLASSGNLRLFWRFSAAPGHLLAIEELEPDDPMIGSRIVPLPDQMPPSAIRELYSGVLAMPVDASTAVAGALLADAHPTVVLFESARPSIAFIPDETVEVTLHAVEVSSVEVEALRQSMADNLDPERLKAARALQRASLRVGPRDLGRNGRKRLSAALAAYVANRLRADISSSDEIRRIQNGCALLIELEGDLTIGEIDADRLRRFRDEKLSQVPAHEGRARLKFKTGTVSATMAAIAGTDWPLMSHGQRDLRMQWIRAWFRWLTAQGWIALDVKVQ
jgi:hypothetical protein